MIRVLQVYPQMNNAGTEMVIMNLFKNIESHKIKFDFLVQKKGIKDDEIKKLGGNIFYIKNYNKSSYYNALLEFLTQNNDIDIVHTHTHKEMGIVLKAAKKAGIKIRIAHSHNARQDLPKLAKLYKYFTSWNIEKNATHFFACSIEAAKWLFPKKYKQYIFIPNGIDTKKFKFSMQKRKDVRSQLKINESDFIVGHVGRLAKQKNHDYMLKIAKNYKDKSVKFICVGEGPLYKELIDKVKSNNLDFKVKFIGAFNDVENLYCAFDAFILPSLHEGLGIVAIEAQASGLSCILSENVPKDADVKINQCYFMTITDDNVSNWIYKIENIRNTCNITNRKDSYDLIRQTKYDIHYSAKMIENFYINTIIGDFK